MSLAGGRDLKPGDVIRIKVVNVNDDGTFQAAADEDESREESNEPSMEKMKNELAAFDKEGAM